MESSADKIANVEQAHAWDGDEGEFWALHEKFYDDAVSRHHARFLATASIAHGDHVLDLGCGNGQATRDAGRAAGGGRAVGIDLSSAMLRRAVDHAAAEGLTNVTFIKGDAQVHPFEPGAFTNAVSRFGSMFFEDQVAAFTNIGKALQPGARLTLLSWRDLAQNEWISCFREAFAVGRTLPTPPVEAPSPFRHADPERVRIILTRSGFSDVASEPIDEPMYFGSRADEGMAILADGFGWMLEGLDEAERATALESLRATLTEHETKDGVAYDSAAWLHIARKV